MYFRWTLGHFPGAQPPLEFWDGTPVQVDGEVTEQGRTRQRKVWDFADTKSKNILWKARVPGWGLSHPIVVGTSRIFSVPLSPRASAGGSGPAANRNAGGSGR